jgi:hypothetical protein
MYLVLVFYSHFLPSAERVEVSQTTLSTKLECPSRDNVRKAEHGEHSILRRYRVGAQLNRTPCHQPLESPHHTVSLPESFHRSHDPGHALPEVYYGPEILQSHTGQGSKDHDTIPATDAERDAGRGLPKTRICGLSKKTFFIVLAIVFLMAAIAGGVTGGVLGTRHESHPVCVDRVFLERI